MSLLKMLSPADYFSIANGAIGALGILYFIDGSEKHIMFGIVLILIAMFMDGLDGTVARRFGSKHHLGVYLDSMADSVSFCFAPAVFVYKLFYDLSRGGALEDMENFLAVSAAISIATVGIIRLSVFSYFKENKLKTFLGLPTPSMAFFVLTGGIIFQDHTTVFLPILIAIVSLMLMSFPYPKINTKPLIAISFAGLIFGIGGATMGAYGIDNYRIPFIVAFGIILLYIAYPLLMFLAGKKIAEVEVDEIDKQK